MSVENDKYDYLIVGSGLFGATFAKMATKAGKRCLVIDRRKHAGGNVYCSKVEGINVHHYGAHIFYTSDAAIWNFVNRLTDFNRFTNSPIANFKGRLFNLPFNMNTFSQMWGVRTPDEAKAKIEAQRRYALEQLQSREPANLEEQALSLVGKDIYETLIKGYNEKQWGRDCKELPAFILRRIPLRFTFDNNYYDVQNQGVPTDGYNTLIAKLLEGCDVRLETDFKELADSWRSIARKLLYTGPLDEYFNFRLGRLDWRTVKFESEILDMPNYQGVAVMNFTDKETPWTRIIEHKHFEAFGNAVYDNPKTVISREYSVEYAPGMEPFYPVNNAVNEELAERYRQLMSQERDVIYGGRLGDYKYFNMSAAISSAIEMASRELEVPREELLKI